jgi:hypothetical protein
MQLRPARLAVRLGAAVTAGCLALVAATASAAPAAPAAGSGHPGHSAGPTPADRPPAVDHGRETFQPGYLDGRAVVYRPGAPAPDAQILPLYQVRYPDRWWERTARPQCDYCDHAGDGADASDFHDHLLGRRPDPAANAAGRVTWQVSDVVPGYTGEARTDAAVTEAYAAYLPVRSIRELRRLLAARTADGTAVARVVDTGIVFGGPITSRF